MINVSSSYIGYIERGEKGPSIDLLDKIAKAFQIDPYILLTSNKKESNKELKKLVAILADKKPEHIHFINQVSIAYFNSLKGSENIK